MITREELNFMNSILNNDGALDPHKPLSLDQTSWLNRYAEQGFWGYGLNIAGGWLTDTGRDYFIEMLWDDELPRGATSLRLDVALQDVDQFVNDFRGLEQDNQIAYEPEQAEPGAALRS